jgi:DNA anti-recombination protein RmuC
MEATTIARPREVEMAESAGVGLEDFMTRMDERFDRIDERFDRADEKFDEAEKRSAERIAWLEEKTAERLDRFEEKSAERFDRFEEKSAERFARLEEKTADGFGRVNERIDRVEEKADEQFVETRRLLGEVNRRFDVVDSQLERTNDRLDDYVKVMVAGMVTLTVGILAGFVSIVALILTQL